MKIPLTKSEKYIESETVVEANPNITRAVGYSMGGSVALELQKKTSAITK